MVLLRHLLGDVLRRLRLRQGRTLREVSASARVSLGYLSEVERGQKEASSELLSAICTALDTPLSHVLREVSDNFALAELQNSPVLGGPREPVLSGAGASSLGKRVQPVLNPAQDRVLGPVRLGARRASLRPGDSPLVPDDAAGLDHLSDAGDVTNMVPV
jgi:transcriptional regulator with XRE-family HTH domain